MKLLMNIIDQRKPVIIEEPIDDCSARPNVMAGEALRKYAELINEWHTISRSGFAQHIEELQKQKQREDEFNLENLKWASWTAKPISATDLRRDAQEISAVYPQLDWATLTCGDNAWAGISPAIKITDTSGGGAGSVRSTLEGFDTIEIKGAYV